MTPLLLDMGLPRRTAGDLRDAGWDAVHVAEVGKASATDAELIALARAERRAVVTLDSDFARLLATSRATTPSLLHLRLEGLDRARATALLRELLPTVDGDLGAGSIVVVTDGGVRVRPLPVG